jgi:hypothetical protein
MEDSESFSAWIWRQARLFALFFVASLVILFIITSIGPWIQRCVLSIYGLMDSTVILSLCWTLIRAGPSEQISISGLPTWIFDFLHSAVNFGSTYLGLRLSFWIWSLSVAKDTSLFALPLVPIVYMWRSFASRRSKGAIESKEDRISKEPSGSTKCLEADIIEIKPYEYERLEAGHIRLLRLLGSNSEGIICAELDPYSIHSLPDYEAISYRWAGEQEPVMVLINGQKFKVSPKVNKILKDHSVPSQPKLIWIDSICINQNDNREKSEQIPLMKDIYRQASVVQACLDRGKSDTTAGLWFQFITATLLYNCTDILLRLFWVSNNIDARRNSFSAKAWSAFQQITDNEYFGRAWIVQEIAVSTNLRIIYGGSKIAWYQMQLLLSKLTSKKPPDSLITLWYAETQDSINSNSNVSSSRQYRVMRNFMNCYSVVKIQLLLRKNGPLPLQQVLRIGWPFDAKVAHDKIYAFLGLSSADVEHPLLKPDYEKPICQVFRDAALYTLLQNDTGIFNCSGIGSSRKISGLPSWVPDWTCPLNIVWSDEGVYNASGGVAPIIKVGDDQHSIHIAGLPLDTIRYVSSKTSPLVAAGHNIEAATLEGFEWCCEIVSLVMRLLPDRYINGQTRNDALWAMFTEGEWNEGVPKISPDETLEAMDLIHRGILPDLVAVKGMSKFDEIVGRISTTFKEDEVPLPKQAKMTDLVRKSASLLKSMYGYPNFRFCVTEMGYIGVVPSGSRIGDEIVVIPGLKTPGILRQCNSCTEFSGAHPCYHFVGDCNIQGIMDGEIMKGEAVQQVFSVC